MRLARRVACPDPCTPSGPGRRQVGTLHLCRTALIGVAVLRGVYLAPFGALPEQSNGFLSSRATYGAGAPAGIRTPVCLLDEAALSVELPAPEPPSPFQAGVPSCPGRFPSCRVIM